jgi:hypothetical protein
MSVLIADKDDGRSSWAQSQCHYSKNGIQDGWVFKFKPRSGSNFCSQKLPLDQTFYVAVGTLHNARNFRLDRAINVPNVPLPSGGNNVFLNRFPLQRLFHCWPPTSSVGLDGLGLLLCGLGRIELTQPRIQR